MSLAYITAMGFALAGAGLTNAGRAAGIVNSTHQIGSALGLARAARPRTLSPFTPHPNTEENTMISTFNVVGMTCDHCTRSVAEEVAQVAGVDDVSVDLASGVVTVSSSVDVDATAIGDAVEEAGYELVV